MTYLKRIFAQIVKYMLAVMFAVTVMLACPQEPAPPAWSRAPLPALLQAEAGHPAVPVCQAEAVQTAGQAQGRADLAVQPLSNNVQLNVDIILLDIYYASLYRKYVFKLLIRRFLFNFFIFAAPEK